MGLDIEKARAAIAAIESQGSGDYAALGPVTNRGDRAYGRYQVMGANIPQWSQEALGRQLTPEQFGADKDAQEAVFAHRFQKLYDQYGTVNDAASAWFTGRPQRVGGDSKDILGTSGNQYVAKFAKAYGADGDAGGYADTGDQPVAPGIMTPPTAVADMPAEGAAEAQGILSQGTEGRPGAYQPTLTDNLNGLSAALLRRDSPQAAASIDANLRAKQAENSAFLRAQQASERWTTGKPYQQADKTWVIPQSNNKGGYRTVPMTDAKAPMEEPKDETPTRQEVQATGRRDIALSTLGQLEVVDEHVNTLRKALQLGNFEVGPDKTGKMVVNNLTGNSTENDRHLKAMESSIIAAATAIAQTQKGGLTNFKFAKDIEQVVPMFAQHDKKALYESLTRVTDGIGAAMKATSDTIVTAGKQFPKNLGTMLHPVTGEDTPVAQYYADRIKKRGENEKALKEGVHAFMASPGRGAVGRPAAPEAGFVKNGYKFNGGNPADQANWQKVE